MSLRLSGGRKLQSPPGDRARPTAARVRLAVFNRLAPRLSGCRWLDLCSGSGVMACEALQHGASLVIAVEQDRRIAQVARANLAAVASGLHDPGEWRLDHQDAQQWLSGPSQNKPRLQRNGLQRNGLQQKLLERNTLELKELERAGLQRKALEHHSDAGPAGRADGFDLIYLDPPYAAGLYEPLTLAVRAGDWLNPDGLLLWECARSGVPDVPPGFELQDRRRYGATEVVTLQLSCRAGCRGDTDSRLQ